MSVIFFNLIGFTFLSNLLFLTFSIRLQSVFRNQAEFEKNEGIYSIHKPKQRMKAFYMFLNNVIILNINLI